MPCRSDYMEPRADEILSKDVCGYLVYVFASLNLPCTPQIAHGANDYYGDLPNLHNNTALLCKTIGELTEEQLETIVYDPRNRTARRLATWWENHQEADRKREKAEQAEIKRQQLRASALAKLTPEEAEALKD